MSANAKHLLIYVRMYWIARDMFSPRAELFRQLALKQDPDAFLKVSEYLGRSLCETFKRAYAPTLHTLIPPRHAFLSVVLGP